MQGDGGRGSKYLGRLLAKTPVLSAMLGYSSFRQLTHPNILPYTDDMTAGGVVGPEAKVDGPNFRLFPVFSDVLDNFSFRQLPLASASKHIAQFRRHDRWRRGGGQGAQRFWAAF